jgi:hypothetical protein
VLEISHNIDHATPEGAGGNRGTNMPMCRIMRALMPQMAAMRP